MRKWLVRVGGASAGVVAAGAIAVAVAVLARPFPVEDLELKRADSLRLRDSQGRLLREMVNGAGSRAEWRPLAEISPWLAKATVAVEDARFASHHGVDWIGVARAAWQDARARRAVSGASTLSMQLARRIHPHRRTLGGKVLEMVDALRLERAISKEALLEQYLNRAPYGADAVGVEAASQRYFGKPSAHLSLAEAALLAGLPKGPTGLNPLRNPAGARERQRLVLDRMRLTGAISQDEHDRAVSEPLQLASAAPPSAMHFTEWVRGGLPGRGGDVTTTLDADLQQAAEGLVAAHVRALESGGVTNAAVVVLDNRQCDVLAMVGSADYWDARAGSVNGALARRQPGSALKPFTYALAFENGDSPASVVADVETRYGDPDGDLFVPKNYSEEFSGPVLLGEALGRSLNVPAIRVANRVGAPALLDRLHQLGVASLDQPASHYGLGLTLGNGEVTLLELTQAYAALARGGLTCTPSGISGQARPAPRRAFEPDVAWLVTDVLSDETLRVRAFGPANALMLAFPVAVKTGTSTNWRDNWAIGYTPRYTVGVWTGDFEGRPLNHLAGASGAGPLFHKVMTLAVHHTGRDETPHREPLPEGMVETEVCAVSGARPGPHCPTRRTVRVRAADVPKQTCPWHRVLAVDKRNGLLAGEKCPVRFVEHRSFEVLPSTYAAWQSEHGREAPPTRYSPHCPHTGTVKGAVVVTYPRKGEVFLVEPGYERKNQTLELAAEADPLPPELAFWVDGKEVSRAGFPYQADWPLEPGHHRLEAVARGVHSDPVAFEVR